MPRAVEPWPSSSPSRPADHLFFGESPFINGRLATSIKNFASAIPARFLIASLTQGRPDFFNCAKALVAGWRDSLTRCWHIDCAITDGLDSRKGGNYGRQRKRNKGRGRVATFYGSGPVG